MRGAAPRRTAADPTNRDEIGMMSFFWRDFWRGYVIGMKWGLPFLALWILLGLLGLAFK